MNAHNHTASGLELERLHTVPTHLTTVDTVLSLGELSLSARQCLLLLVGGSLGAALWTRTAAWGAWLPPVGLALHWTLVLLLGICTLVLTFGQAQGRSFDSWVVVVMAYLARPRRALWRSLHQHPVSNRSLSSSSSLETETPSPLLMRMEGGEQGETTNQREEPVA